MVWYIINLYKHLAEDYQMNKEYYAYFALLSFWMRLVDSKYDSQYTNKVYNLTSSYRNELK